MHDFWSVSGPLYHPLRLLHIAAGSIALFAAPVALALTKGSAAHRRAGWVYISVMGVVAASALLLALIKPNPFLLLLAVFSFYLSLTGVRLLRLKYRDAARRAPVAWDHLISGVMAVAALGLLALALLGFRQGNGFAIVYLIFGGISLALVAAEYQSRRVAETNTKRWLSLHIQRMMAAYISTVTAFSAVNFGRWFPHLPSQIIWLWPICIGTAAIFYFILRYVLGSKPRPVQVRS